MSTYEGVVYCLKSLMDHGSWKVSEKEIKGSFVRFKNCITIKLGLLLYPFKTCGTEAILPVNRVETHGRTLDTVT